MELDLIIMKRAALEQSCVLLKIAKKNAYQYLFHYFFQIDTDLFR